MSFKSLKRIVAQVLVFTVLIPNLNAMALDVKSDNTNNAEVKEDFQPKESMDTDNIVDKDDSLSEKDNIDKKDEPKNIPQKDSVSEKENTPKKESIPGKDIILEQDKNSVENVDEKEEIDAVEDVAKKSEVIVEKKSEEVIGKKYNKRKTSVNGQRAYSPAMYAVTTEIEGESERLEYKLTQEAVENLTVLEKITDKPYEVALAHSDGDYTFVGGFNTLEEAMNNANTMPTTYSVESVLPAIIDSKGQVVYSTKSIAAVRKYVGGNVVNGTSNIYSDSSLSNAFTYINHNYVEDAPILSDNGTSAKVMVNGLEGWMNKNISSGNYDIAVYPINQVKNPSYYSVVNGELNHYISSDLASNVGHSRIVGKAPSYLKAGVKYLSYDGVYFYDGSNIESALNILTNDYRQGKRDNAVNAGNPHYLYYNNLPFRSKTIYSAADLDRFINAKTQGNSKLRNIGAALKSSEEKYGVNALLTLGVAINESAWGTSNISQSKNNLFGIKAYDSDSNQASHYTTPGDSVIDFSRDYISRGYSDPADWRYYGGFLGNKHRGANVKYASDPFWGEKAASYAYEADKYLSNGIANLKDTNAYKIGITTSNNTVFNSSGSALYSIVQRNTYTPFIITNNKNVNISGQNCYEIYPERNTSVNTIGSGSKYHGNYDWNYKGYIKVSGVNIINQGKGNSNSDNNGDNESNKVKPSLEVRAGSDRYHTAVELSKSKFNSADTVVISNGYAMIDGLTATPVATSHNAPILLTDTNNVPGVTENEIKRLGVKNIIIVGGNQVVSSAVESKLRNLGVNKITRLGGRDRYETSLIVAKYIDENIYDIENVVLTSGYGEADAMSISPVAGRDKMPIILTEIKKIPVNTQKWLRSESLKNAYIIGGTDVVSSNVLNEANKITVQNIEGNRLGGKSRYETNAMVIDKFYGETINKVYLAKGIELIDALSAGPIAALNASPIVIADNSLVKMQKDVLKKRNASVVVQAGYGVATSIVEELRNLLSKAN